MIHGDRGALLPMADAKLKTPLFSIPVLEGGGGRGGRGECAIERGRWGRGETVAAPEHIAYDVNLQRRAALQLKLPQIQNPTTRNHHSIDAGRHLLKTSRKSARKRAVGHSPYALGELHRLFVDNGLEYWGRVRRVSVLLLCARRCGRALYQQK